MKTVWKACIATTALVAVGYQAGWAQEVGSIAAVNRDMQGTPPAGGARTLNLGDQVVTNERIETSKLGSGQIMFLDQTTLAVAPNSDVVLDKYVFDPASNSGEIALSMTQGALRFIGGRITKRTKAVVRTPQSTIGIRGGMALVTIEPDGGSKIILMAGEFVDVTGADGGILTLSRPNATATVDGSGNVEFSGIATSEDLAAIFKSLEGQGDGGKDGETVSEDGVSTVAEVNSEETGAADLLPISTQGETSVGSDLNVDDDSILTELQAEEVVVEEPVESVEPAEPEPGPVVVEPPLAPPTALPQSGAVVISTNSEPAEISVSPVTSITEGSIIAQTAAGDTLTLSVPSDPRQLQPQIPGNTDFGLWTQADVDGPQQLNGEDALVVTGLSSIDSDDPFHVVSLETPSNTALAILGNPTVGQGAVHDLDDGSLGATTNTIDVFRPINIDLLPAGSDSGGLNLVFVDSPGTLGPALAASAPLLVTGNANESRISADGSAPTATRALLGQVSEGRLGVLAGELGTVQGTGLSVQSAVTNISRNSVQSQSFGAIADGDGNTLFGQEGEFTVLSTAGEELGSTEIFSGANAGILDNAQTATLFHRDLTTTAAVDGNSDLFVDFSEININSPLDLPDLQLANVAHANGFFGCSTGNCGTSLSGGGSTGVWGVQAVGSLSAGGTFQAADGSLQSFDNNSLAARLSLRALDEVNANIGGVQIDNDALLQLDNGFQQGNETSTFINDRLFGFNSPDSALFEGNAVESEFLFVSSGAADQFNDTLFPNGVNTDPDVVRWGYFGIDLSTNDGTGTTARHDTLTNGFFVFGRTTVGSELPSNIVAQYDGLVAASLADLNTGTIREVGGSFALTFDFQSGDGAVDLAIPDAGYTFTSIDVTQSNSGFGGTQNFGTDGTSTVSLDGSFFGSDGGSSPATGVGGSLDIQDVDRNARALGIFAADRTSTEAAEPVTFQVAATSIVIADDVIPASTSGDTAQTGGDVALATAGSTSSQAPVDVAQASVSQVPQSEFLSWGQWEQASGETGAAGNVDGSQGTWSGTPTSAQDLPSDIVARYDGAIAATQFTSDGAAEAVGGQFGLTYDFGQGAGAADIAIPDAGYDISNIQVNRAGAGFQGAQTFGADGTATVRLDGEFFTAGGVAAGGVGGGLAIDDPSAGTRTEGVFSGALQTTSPSVAN